MINKKMITTNFITKHKHQKQNNNKTIKNKQNLYKTK